MNVDERWFGMIHREMEKMEMIPGIEVQDSTPQNKFMGIVRLPKSAQLPVNKFIFLPRATQHGTATPAIAPLSQLGRNS